MKITFLASGIKEEKKEISTKYDIEHQAERFRQDMLAKHNLLFKKAPHVIQIDYGFK